MSYTVNVKTIGDVDRSHGRYINEYYEQDHRVWVTEITFDTPVTPELLELIKQCRPTRSVRVRGKKKGWLRYEKAYVERSIGDVSMVNPTTVRVTFTDTQGTYHIPSGSSNHAPYESHRQNQFLTNLGEKLVELQTVNNQ